uniref:Fibronectin type III-like domain-containing protein n=1 Tax=Kalanchoe fedtschenkoi TaxID=63787 RepID=A0A7N0ZR99_KALFE
MASSANSFLLFISIFFVIFTVSFAARHHADPHTISTPNLNVNGNHNYSIVCDETKFLQLGVEMKTLGYCDKSLSYQVRAKDLVDRMTLREKVQQLGNTAPGVPRLGLPKYEWWSEALHGVSHVGPGVFFDESVPGATSFPTVILSTAAFNETLWKKIGEAVSTEGRAMYNLGHAGLTYWSPVINVVRDPRWGRTTETPGEDPYVVGVFAKDYVRGLQDVEGTENVTDLNSRPLKVSSCCKHFAAYDVDQWMSVDRFHFDAEVRDQDMKETFLKPFEMCVKEGDVSSVMCSYNRVNKIPACADVELLKNTIRGKWNLHGYIVSDCDSIDVMVTGHKWLGDTLEEASAQVMIAGMDLDCGWSYDRSLANAVHQGKVSEKTLDESLINLFVVLMRLGFFDDTTQFAYLGKSDICSEEHIELATDAARQGIVLLKNNATLPLSPSKYKKFALVGPHANATVDMIGNYAGIPCRYTSPLKAFQDIEDIEVTYAEGCDVLCQNDTFIFKAMQAAKSADVTILFVGTNLSIEAEGRDRVDLLLPGYQKQLVDQVSLASRGPVILVVLSAGGVDINFAKGIENIRGVIWAGQPGEQGGKAIADVIFGKYNPGGRLPVTWHQADYVDQLPLTSMPLRPIRALGYPGRTYKFFNGPVVYPFGYGLSYTTFTYSLAGSTTQATVNINQSQYQHCRNLPYSSDSLNPKPNCPALNIDDLKCDETFDYQVNVKNTGDRDGSEIVIVYSKPPAGIKDTHIKQVVGFDRVFVRAGETQVVKFTLNVCKSLGLFDETGYHVLPQGMHIITAGDGQVPYQVNVRFSN